MRNTSFRIAKVGFQPAEFAGFDFDAVIFEDSSCFFGLFGLFGLFGGMILLFV
jgi:hypothetical protein